MAEIFNPEPKSVTLAAAPSLSTTPITGEFKPANHSALLLSELRRVNALAYAASVQELVCQAMDLLIEYTQAESATYLAFDANTKEMQVVAIRGDDESQHLVGLRFPRQETLLQAALTADQPIVIGELADDPRWLRIASPASAARMKNLISLPLVTQNQLVGVIQIYNFKQAHLDQLELIRERLAIDIERKTTLEKTQQTNRRLYELIDTIGQFGADLDRKQLISSLLEKTASLVDAERVSIFLTDPKTNEMVFQFAYQTPQGQLGPKPHPHGTTSPQPLDLPSQSRDEFNLFSHSAITVPIHAQPTDASQPEKPRHIGGLMALNPNTGEFTGEDIRILNILAQQTSTFLQMADIFESTEELFLDTIKTMVTAMDAKDAYTQGHSQRVSEYSVMIAQELGLSPTQINDIRIGSLLHDLGKIGIPDSILKKNGTLNSDEWAMVKSHPMVGWNILRQVKLLEPVLPAILEHHEKLDGSGYPNAHKGDQISLMGRIVSVADVFDAMTSDRPYRPALKVPDVIDYLVENAGSKFDTRCVVAMRHIIGRNNETE